MRDWTMQIAVVFRVTDATSKLIIGKFMQPARYGNRGTDARSTEAALPVLVLASAFGGAGVVTIVLERRSAPP